MSLMTLSDDDDLLKANATFRKLITLHNHLTVLADMFTLPFSSSVQSRNDVEWLENLCADDSADFIGKLGALHRTFIGENVLLKDALLPKDAVIADLSTIQDATTTTTPPADSGSHAADSSVGVADATANPSASSETQTTRDGSPELNTQALKHLASQVPNTLGPFFQGKNAHIPASFAFANVCCLAISKAILQVQRQSAQSPLVTLACRTLAEVTCAHLKEVSLSTLR